LSPSGDEAGRACSVRGFCDSFRDESRCGFGRGEKHRNDGHSQRRFGGGANDCPVASRQAVFGFGRGAQRSQASVGGGGGMCETRSSGCVGNADTEQVVTTRGPRPQRCGTAADEGNSSRGTNRVAGKPPDRARVRDSSHARARGRRKRNEPHGRYQVAIDPGLARRANRQGGEKPRRRNAMTGWYRAYEAASFGRSWVKPACWEYRRRGRRMTKKGGLASISASVGVGGKPAL